jgi:uncharacterized protein
VSPAVAVTVDVRDLLGQPGASRAVRVHEPVPGLATELARVPEDRPVEADLLVESVVEGLLVSGPVEGTMDLICARCLKPVEAGFHVEVQEMFAPGAKPQDEEYPVQEGVADLEPMIRDAVMLAMPFSPLCQPDCLGLCPRCGGDRNLGECACPPEGDDRWAPLMAIEFEEDDGERSR